MPVEVGWAEKDGHDAVRSRFERARDYVCRAAIASQGVYSDPDGHLLRGRRAEGLDFAAAIGAAIRADAMRPLGAVAVRAQVQTRRFDAVLGAALVTARLGCSPFRDCHRRPTIAASRPRPSDCGRDAPASYSAPF